MLRTILVVFSSFNLIFISSAILGVVLICASEGVSGNQAPYFDNLQTYFSVKDSTAVGSVVLNLRAVDVDDDAVTFSVTLDHGDYGNSGGNSAGNNILTIRQTGPKTADVLLVTPLNGTVASFTFIFSVNDGTNVAISQPSIMYVVPSSFSPPSILNLPASVQVAEDAVTGSQMYKVAASDTSSIVTFEMEENGGKFQIDWTTGVVTLIGKLDYHLQKSYLLYVVATNKRGLNVTGQLSINVTNSKNRPPYFLNSSYSVTLPGNVTKGFPVIVVQAYDGNTDVPIGLTYKFIFGKLNLFTINSSSGLVATLDKLDCSTASIKRTSNCTFYSIIEACEQPLKRLGPTCSTILLAVSIPASNIYVPKFSSLSYECYVYRNSPPNVPIGCSQIISIDTFDLESVVALNISLQPANASNWLAIEEGFPKSTSYILRLKNNTALSQIESNQMTVKIVATATSSAGNATGTANVEVYLVGDDNAENDQFVFTQEQYDVTLRGAQGPGAPVVTVKASSIQTPASDDVVYSLQGSFSNAFAVDEKSGQITLSQPELIGSSNSLLGITTLVVVAKNKMKSQSAWAVVTVRFEAVKLPKIVKMSSENYVAILEENSNFFNPQPFFVKAYVVSSDSTATTMNYFINEGSVYSKNFTINQSTGEIRPKSPLDYEALPLESGGVVNFSLGARLADDAASVTYANVSVFLKDVNDNSPKFLQSSYSFSSGEPLKKGLLGKVMANDADATRPNNVIVYSMTPDFSPSSSPSFDSDFIIYSSTGLIYYVGPSSSSSTSLVQKNQTFTVTATDMGLPPLSSSVKISVTYYQEVSSSSFGSCSGPGVIQAFQVNANATAGSVVAILPESIKRSVADIVNGSNYSKAGGGGFTTTGKSGTYRCSLGNVYIYDWKGDSIANQQGVELFTLNAECTQVLLGISLESNYRLARLVAATLSVTNQSEAGGAKNFTKFDIATVIIFINPNDLSGNQPTFLPIQNGGLGLPDAEVSPQLPFISTIGRVVAVVPSDLNRSIRYSVKKNSVESNYFSVNERLGSVFFNKSDLDFSVSKTVNISVVAMALNDDSSSSGVKSETVFSVRLLQCTRPYFKTKRIVVGLATRDVRIGMEIIDLKDYTLNWSSAAVYFKDNATVADYKTEAVAVETGGSVISKGLLRDDPLEGLEFKVMLSTSNCGDLSSAVLSIYFLSNDSLIKLVIGRSASDVVTSYQMIVEQLAGISSLEIFPYAILKSSHDSSQTSLLLYSYSSSEGKLVTYPDFVRLLGNLNQSQLMNFKNDRGIVDVLPYSTEWRPVQPFPLSTTASCLPLVIALSVICSLFFVFVVLLISAYFFVSKRQKQKKKSKSTYSNSAVIDYVNSSERHIQGADGEFNSTVSRSSGSSSRSDASDPTSTTASSTRNFIDYKDLARVDSSVISALPNGIHNSIYDSLRSGVLGESVANLNGSNNNPYHFNSSTCDHAVALTRESATRDNPPNSTKTMLVGTGVVNSNGSLAVLSQKSMLSDSAIGSTDNCATAERGRIVGSYHNIVDFADNKMTKFVADVSSTRNMASEAERLRSNSYLVNNFHSQSGLADGSKSDAQLQPRITNSNDEVIYNVVNRTSKPPASDADNSSKIVKKNGEAEVGFGSKINLGNSHGLGKMPPSYNDLVQLSRSKVGLGSQFDLTTGSIKVSEEDSFYI